MSASVYGLSAAVGHGVLMRGRLVPNFAALSAAGPGRLAEGNHVLAEQAGLTTVRLGAAPADP